MDKLQRKIGTFALMMTGVGSMIGSGWLFGSWKAAKVAGPAAVLAWVIGMFVVLLIGLTYAELGAMFPESGGTVRYAQYSHGSLVGFIAGWANWIAIVSVIPIEAEASIQYMSSWKWHWAQALYNAGTSTLTVTGLLLAAVLVIVYFFLNYWTVELFSRANTLITLVKFAVPALTVIGLVCAGFHPSNFTNAATGGFHPFGWASVLSAVATSGIVFAFNGFQSPVNLAGEAKNPNRSVPLAIIGSVILAAFIYVLLQTAFIGSVRPDMLSGGWSHIELKSPFADLALAWGLNWLAIVLFADAFVSPSGTGITYTATTARMVYGMTENGWFPRVFGAIHPFYRVPRRAMWLNLLIAYVFLAIFRGWGDLASVISVATIISYVTGPVAVVTLRKIAPDIERPLKIRGIRWISLGAFIMASLMLYWSKWPLTGEVTLVMLIGLPMYLYYQAKGGWQDFGKQFKSGLWVIVYLVFMILVSLFGSKSFHGMGIIPYGWDMLIVAIGAVFFYLWGTRSGFLDKGVQEYRVPSEQHTETFEG